MDGALKNAHEIKSTIYARFLKWMILMCNLV